MSRKRKVTRSIGRLSHLLYCNLFCRVYLSQMQPFLQWGLCHAVHTLTLLPPTEMPHQGEAFSSAHINSCLLVAWEMLKYIHLRGLFLSATLNSRVWPCHCFAQAFQKCWSDYFKQWIINVLFPTPRSGLDIWSCHQTEYITKCKKNVTSYYEMGVWVGSLDVKWKHLLEWSHLWLREAEQWHVGLPAAPVRAIR